MWVYDRETLRFLAVNDDAVSHMGYSREKFLAMTLPEIRRPKSGGISEFVRTAQGSMTASNVVHVKADGTEIETAIYSRALQYEGRRALVAILRCDEQRRAERDAIATRNSSIRSSRTSGLGVRQGAARAALHPGQSGGRADVGSRARSVIGKTSHDIFPSTPRICSLRTTRKSWRPNASGFTRRSRLPRRQAGAHPVAAARHPRR